MKDKIYNIQKVSLLYRLINTATILTTILFLFCFELHLNTLEVLISVTITIILLVAIGFFFKKTMPKTKIILDQKGFTYSSERPFPLKKSESYFFPWSKIIGYETFTISWATEFQLNFKDMTCFKFSRANIWVQDDFDKMYSDLIKYRNLFQISENLTPIGITIYETRWIQIAMTLLTAFTIFIGYYSISEPNEGSIIIISIFGFSSLYYWYKVMDIWSKKRK